MLLKYKVISGVIWNSINSGYTIILNFGTIFILARILKPEDFGVFAMITVIINILEVFSDMGVSSAIISFKNISDNELSALFIFNIILGIALSILLILLSPLVVYYFKNPLLYPYIWILATNFIITAPSIVFSVLMRKYMKFKILSKIKIVAFTIYGIGTISYAIISKSIMSLVFGTLIQSVISTILFIYYGKKIWKPTKWVIKYSYLKRFLSFGFYQVGEQLIRRFNINIDYLIIGRFLGKSALGYYSMAYNLMRKPIRNINPIITNVALSALSEIQDDNVSIKHYYLKMTKYIVYVMAPIFTLCFVLADKIILLFLGEKWHSSIQVFGIFAFLGILYAIGNPIGQLILAKGRPDIGFWMNVYQTLFLLIANYIGVKWGIIGVAYSTLIITLFIFFPVGCFVRYYLAKITVAEFIKNIQKPLIFGALAGFIIHLVQKYLLSAYLNLNKFFELSILCSLLLIIYIALIFIFDKNEFQALWKNIKGYVYQKKESQEIEK